MKEKGIKIIATNRAARHYYHILDTHEAGLVLEGAEVKSVREGKVNLKDGFARVEQGEVWLYNMHISPTFHGDRRGYDPLRRRKLLLHKEEIKRLTGKVAERGLTLVPVELYFKKGLVKVSIALAKGKKIYDKREAIKKRDIQRETERVLREHWKKRIK